MQSKQTLFKKILVITLSSLVVGCGGGGGGSSVPSGGSTGATTTTTSTTTTTTVPTMVTPIAGSADGATWIAAPAGNQFVSFTLTMTVPPLPTDKVGQMFIWPGLQTGGTGPATLLQPLLIYGPGGCIQATQAQLDFSTWYVGGYDENSTGACGNGSEMNVNPGDTLTMSIAQTSATMWLQTITDTTTGKTVTLSSTVAAGTTFPLAGLDIEMDNGNTGLTTSAPVAISNITLTLANPAIGAWCMPYSLGPTDTETMPVVSPSNTSVCTISKVTLMTGSTTAGTTNHPL